MKMEKTANASPGRPREFNEKTVLPQIMDLFWENGFESTGLSDIMSKTGLAKASLYAAFGNKQAMYLRAIEHYERVMVDAGCDLLRDKSMSPSARLNTFFSAPIDAIRNDGDYRGCFLCNAAADRAALDKQTADLVSRGYDKLRAALSDVIHELGHSKKDAKNAGAHAMATYTGLRVLARSSVDLEFLMAARDHFLLSLGIEAR